MGEERTVQWWIQERGPGPHIIFSEISHVLNEQGTGYEHIFSSVETFNID